jgi:hypothetical protein
MFRSTVTDTAPPTPDVMEPLEPLVPLSVLQLDLDTPPEGWSNFLAARNIEITLDDIGRMSISRDDARQLFIEKREREAEQARRRKLAEAQAVADDQIRRAQIWQGIPADDLPPGVAPAAVMLQASKDARPKRTSVLQEALAGSETLTYHPLPTSDEDAS